MKNNQEIITLLPECLIIIIISFLPLIDAVRFCSLSKQWFNLWVHCKHLDFDEMLFLETKRVKQLWSNGKYEEASRLSLDGRMRFINYIDHTLPRFVEQEISTFRLRFAYEGKYQDHVEAWVAYVISRDVKVLILDLSHNGAPLPVFRDFNEPFFYVPEFLCEDTSLKVLSLSFCDFTYFNFQRFSGITSLSLRGISVEESLVQNLVTNCSLLEDLCMVNCSIQGTIFLGSPRLNLKKLIIKCCVPLGRGILLVAPNLQYFKYTGLLEIINIGKLGDLAEVILDIRFLTSSFCMKKFHCLLLNLNAARSLKLNEYFIKAVVLDDHSSNQLLFPLVNLIHLTLKTGWIHENELRGIFSLLRSTPNLETLTIQLGSSSDNSRVQHNTMLMDLQYDVFALLVRRNWEPPTTPFRNLKTIKFEGFTTVINEMELLVFLLENTTVLQQLIFSEATNELIKMISCQIEEVKKLRLISEDVTIVFQTVA